MINAAIVGGSGYAGYNLMKILLGHKQVELKIVTSETHAGKNISEIFPDIKSNLKFSHITIQDLNRQDIVFLSVPHGKAKELASRLKCKIIDLTSDHRLTHTYGLPEIFSGKISKSGFVANPGCYATACILAAYPLKDSIDHAVFDCISGYSGGGKNNNYDYMENIIAYKLTDHNHIPEITKTLGISFSFTPHVVNTFSGIMCTAHIFLKGKTNAVEIRNQYKKFYAGTFTKVADDDKIPCTKEVTGTPYCQIGGFEEVKYHGILESSRNSKLFDAIKNSNDNGATNEIVIISVIDNLMKGAASQAVENMNLMFGLNHDEGLR